MTPPSSSGPRSALKILSASRYIQSMCNPCTYNLSPKEIRGLYAGLVALQQ